MKSIKLSLALSVTLLTAACVSQQTYNTEVKRADSYAQLNQQLSAELSSDTAKIQDLHNQLKVTIVDEILFSEGGWELHAKGEAALAKIAPTLASLPGQQIIIEGFTDNVPIGPGLRSRFPSNIELSSARAGAVLRYLAAKGVPMNTMSAQGFGESRPVAGNDTAQGRAQNRRVEIVITAASRP